MTRRHLWTALLIGIVLWIWGAVSWVALPFHRSTLHPLPAAEAEALTSKLERSGIYVHPAWPHGAQSPEALRTYEGRVREGRLVTYLAFRREGVDPVPAWAFVRYLALTVGAGVMAVWLLKDRPWRGFGRRVLDGLALGVLVALLAPLVDANWWHLPLDHTLVLASDHLVGWALAGLVLAWGTRPVRT